MSIKFINHACITIEENGEMIMFDPWFFGKVFNNSWSLIRETDVNDLDLSKLKYILITHEHPDYLHWPTLRSIKNNTTQEIRIIVPKRNNKNIVEGLVKLGYKVAEVPSNKQFKISQNFKITNFVSGHDSAYVIQTKDKTLLNQNDCKLFDMQVYDIKNNYPTIDYYFMQFSLAGFYANKTNIKELNNAKLNHISMIERYKKQFDPKVTIPFASYVYFCREENSFLNNYIVNLNELDDSYQFVSYGDKVLDMDFTNRNEKNKQIWNENITDLKIDKTKEVTDEQLIEAANSFLNTITNVSIPATTFSLYNKNKSFFVDYNKKECCFTETNGTEVAKVTMYDLECFYKFPWGADTMNITSCFEVYNQGLWKQNLIFRDTQYKR